MTYEFYSRFARILNSGQSRSIVVTGNVYDLFWDESGYVPITDFLRNKTKPGKAIQLTYELNGPIRISGTPAEQEAIKDKLTEAWLSLVSGYTGGLQKALEDSLKSKTSTKLQKYLEAFDKAWLDSIANPGVAMDFIRQLCMASRKFIKEPVHVFIESADMIVPAGKDTASLSDAQLARISVLQDLFCDPEFINGKDAVILIVESTSILNERIAKLPQVLTIDIPSPNKEQRKHYIDHFIEKHVVAKGIANYKIWEGDGDLESSTAGLSIYALRQMMLGAVYAEVPLNNASVVDKVEEYIKSQLGEDVVEFSRPIQRIADIRGNTLLKRFFQDELIPRIKEGGLNGMVVPGSIGVGKTYIMGAVMAELGRTMMELKNIRSKWYGGTDIILERLRRVIFSLDKVGIAIDEADTQFGGVGSDVHETERRVTGKIQAMMSDPQLEGKAFWMLMTARVNQLSADIRRPGRAGDMIVPIFDPVNQDRTDFIKWVLDPLRKHVADEAYEQLIVALSDASVIPAEYSAGAFAGLRKHLKSRPISTTTAPLDLEWFKTNIMELLPGDIGPTREYQKLQALVNCTRRSLIPASELNGNTVENARIGWLKRIKELEFQGIK